MPQRSEYPFFRIHVLSRFETAHNRAIALMRAVLDSPTPLTGLVALAKAQQAYHAQAAQILSGIQASLEESAVSNLSCQICCKDSSQLLSNRRLPKQSTASPEFRDGCRLV